MPYTHKKIFLQHFGEYLFWSAFISFFYKALNEWSIQNKVAQILLNRRKCTDLSVTEVSGI